MKKDIPMPPVEDVAIAIVKEEEDAQAAWTAYIVNLKEEPLRNVLITSSGYGELEGKPRKTSTLRHFFDEIGALDFFKIEPVMDFTFGLSNEYWVSFQLGEVMYDKRYVFLPETIKEDNATSVPLIGKKGVMIV